MRTLCIYDNHIEPHSSIKNIIGNKTFGDVILKRKSIKSNFLGFIRKQKVIDEVLELDYSWQIDALVGKIRNYEPDIKIVHIFSNFIILDESSMALLLKKAPFIEENYVCLNEQVPAVLMMDDREEYCQFLTKNASVLQDKNIYGNRFSKNHFEAFSVNGLWYLGNYENFIQYISGGFDARFFNSVKGDKFTVTKTSTNKKKIKAEYDFYRLLPDPMKIWFVMPYNYQELPDQASYEMERYHMTDLAIRWVHGAIDISEFEKLLSKVFHFIQIRNKKNISEAEYLQTEKELYLQKLEERIQLLKEHPQYLLFQKYIENGTKYSGLDEIVSEYKQIYSKITHDLKRESVSVIGHGDLCFSNMLFNKDGELLKLIDPKGAEKEAQLWTNPYYDLAKLSHSICGRYDFFNNGLYHISLDTELKFRLDIDFDNTPYKELFREYLENNGYSYLAVRIYEVSLFLSMLPLHIDNPQKVFGFILNAINILEEIRQCLDK